MLIFNRYLPEYFLQNYLNCQRLIARVVNHWPPHPTLFSSRALMQHGNMWLISIKILNETRRSYQSLSLGKLWQGKQASSNPCSKTNEFWINWVQIQTVQANWMMLLKYLRHARALLAAGQSWSFIILEARLYTILLTNYHPDHNMSHCIAEFDRLATSYGEQEACEKLCFGWLSHLYLSCPKPGPISPHWSLNRAC